MLLPAASASDDVVGKICTADIEEMAVYLLLFYYLCFCAFTNATNLNSSFRQCHRAFTWANNTATTVNTTQLDNGFVVEDFRKSAKLQKLHNHTVLIVGDSLDLHSCFYLRNISRLQNDTHTRRDYTCYDDGHLVVKLVRQNFMGSMTAPVRHKHFESLQPDSIVFSSFVWDILRNKNVYCKILSNIGSCLCDFKKMLNPECAAEIDPQVFNRKNSPWCQDDFINLWTREFVTFVDGLRTFLPQVTIFIRNQPFASSLQLANQLCLGSMNNVAAQVADDLLEPLDRGTSCRLLDMRALLARAADKEMGYGDESFHKANDGLHYYHVASVWTNYMLNTIIDNVVL